MADERGMRGNALGPGSVWGPGFKILQFYNHVLFLLFHYHIDITKRPEIFANRKRSR